MRTPEGLPGIGPSREGAAPGGGPMEPLERYESLRQERLLRRVFYLSPILLELVWLVPWVLLPVAMAGPAGDAWRPYAIAGVILGVGLGFTRRPQRGNAAAGNGRGAWPWLGAAAGSLIITAAALLFRGVQGAEPGMILLGIVSLLLGWWRGSAISGSISWPGSARRQAATAVLMGLGYVLLRVIAGHVEGVPHPIPTWWPLALLVLAALRLGVGDIEETSWPETGGHRTLPVRHQTLAVGMFIGLVLASVLIAIAIFAPATVTGAIKGTFRGLMVLLSPVTAALAWLATAGMRLLTPVIYWVRDRHQEPEPQEPGELESGVPEYEGSHQMDLPPAVGIILLVLIAAGLIYAIIAFVRSRRPAEQPAAIWEERETIELRHTREGPRPFRRVERITGSDAAAKVRRAYRRWLQKQSRAGHGRAIHMTAREYIQVAAAPQQRETRAEARAEGVKAFTYLYERARYQGPEVTHEEARQAAHWARHLDP